jgi:hypothetical protein
MSFDECIEKVIEVWMGKLLQIRKYNAMLIEVDGWFVYSIKLIKRVES